MARVPDLPCAGACGKLMWRSSTALPEGEATCRDCRRQQPVKHGTNQSYRQRGCRCAECKAWNARAHLEYEQRRAAGVYETRACSEEDCLRASHCRSMCKMHYRRWARERGMINSPSDRWSDTRRSNSHARRARMGGAVNGDKVLTAELIARDGLDCSACNKPIETDRAWPHPLSISIDHTTPVSRGGPHSLSNTTLMHLRCNISKGARVGGNQAERQAGAARP